MISIFFFVFVFRFSFFVFQMTTSMLVLAALPVLISWWVMRREKKSVEEKQVKEGGETAENGKRAPSHYGNLTKEKLKQFTGKDTSKPLLVGIKGKIYDVTPVS